MPAQPTTYDQAIDSLFGIVSTALIAGAAIVGYAFEVRWQGNEKPEKPPMNQIWARVSAQIVKDEQASLANSNGVRKYHAKGLVYVQLFCPRTDPDLTNARKVAVVIQTALKTDSADGTLWFTDPKINELKPEALSYPIMISANFEYESLSS